MGLQHVAVCDVAHQLEVLTWVFQGHLHAQGVLQTALIEGSQQSGPVTLALVTLQKEHLAQPMAMGLGRETELVDCSEPYEAVPLVESVVMPAVGIAGELGAVDENEKEGLQKGLVGDEAEGVDGTEVHLAVARCVNQLAGRERPLLIAKLLQKLVLG